MNKETSRDCHCAFRGLGFSLLVIAFLRGLQFKLFPQESSWQSLPGV